MPPTACGSWSPSSTGSDCRRRHAPVSSTSAAGPRSVPDQRALAARRAPAARGRAVLPGDGARASLARRACRAMPKRRRSAQARAPKPATGRLRLHRRSASDEVTAARNEADFRRLTIRPRVLVDVSAVDTSTTLLGRRVELPLVAAPTGLTGLVHHRGELALAGALHAAGGVYTLSTASTYSIEDVAARTRLAVVPDLPVARPRPRARSAGARRRRRLRRARRHGGRASRGPAGARCFATASRSRRA